MKSKLWEWTQDFFFLTLGSALLAAGISCFNAPNGIAAGGLSGLGTIVNHLTGFPIGIFTLALNIPIFIVGTMKLGFRFLRKSIYASVVVSVLVDLFGTFAPKYTGDLLLACLYGGVLSGAGVAFAFLRGATTGGTDIIAKLLNVAKPHLSVGRLILLIDFVIVLMAVIAYGNIENGLYAVITIFSSSKVIDIILSGRDRGTVMLVNSRKNEEIATFVMDKMSRGVTLLQGIGAYTGKENRLLLCAVRVHEVARLKRIVRDIDSTAFVVMLEAQDILGEGFKQE